MTAKELHELVKDWPREAWPEGVSTETHEDDRLWLLAIDDIYVDEADEDGEEWKRDAKPLDDRVQAVSSIGSTKLAAALFRDSGLQWLSRENRGPVRVWHCGDHWHLEIERGFHGENRSCLLELIDAAIRKTVNT